MLETNLKFEKVTKENINLSIKIQNEIFPQEDGTLNLKLAINKNLIIKIFGDFKKYREISKYWLVYFNKNIIGITGIYSYYEYPTDAWVGWFGVLPKYRGLGFGKTILYRTMEEAKKHSFKNLRLYTDLDSNKTAVNLYRKIGMVEEPYLVENMGTEKISIFSKSLTFKKTEKFGNKNLFLKEQENLQKKAKLLS